MHTLHLEHLPLLVSLEPEVDLAHTHQRCDYSISQAAEQSGESQHVLTNLHVGGMEGKRRKIASFADPGGPRAPLRSNFDDPEGWDTSGSEEECAQRDVVYRMALLLAAQSSSVVFLAAMVLVPLSVVENGYKAGEKPATCRTCGKTFPRPNISGIKSRIASPTRSQKSSVLSWSEALCEQSRGQVETVWPAAMGSCAPSEPVPFSSSFVATSEHAVISGLSAGSFAPMQSKSRVDCVETHGLGGVESVPRTTCISTPSKPVSSLLV